MELEEFLEHLDALHLSYNRERMKLAFEYASKAHEGQFRQSGEPYVTHPIQVALILAELDLDEDTIIAGLLHDVVEDTFATVPMIFELFGAEVANIVDGVTKIEKMHYESKVVEQAENFRKMLLAMSKDIRVILVKLADRLHNMRTLKYKSDATKIIKADETLEIYVPLAHRLGIYRLKWELEDLAFLYKEPEKYRELVAKVDRKRREREQDLKTIMTKISESLNESGIAHTIYGRPKNLYSIYRKMTVKKYAFEEIHDLTAIRVIVSEIPLCYAALGIIHSKWKPIPGRFKDYIAMPKPNMYQSLHTTLLGENGETFEVQIRTEEMHRVAEYGIAAHWKYKEKGSEIDMNWVNQLMEWQRELENPTEFIDSIKMDLFNSHVYVFTPKGNVIELPDGGTPVDFAYKIHTDVGNHCVGAKVNGRIVPLNYTLKIGDIVEILTTKSLNGPSRDWLSFVKSSQAKNKIRAYFKKQNVTENIEKGKDILERELSKYQLSLKQVMTEKITKELLDKLTSKTMDHIYASIGYGDMDLRQIMPTIRQEFIPEEEKKVVKPVKHDNSSSGFVVQGSTDMLIRRAKCCNPIPGDQIIGFITRGSGITVHRSNCTNFNPDDEKNERFIQVHWDDDRTKFYQATLKIVGSDRPGLLTNITNTINNQSSTIRGLNAKVNNNQLATIVVTFDVHDTEDLQEMERKLRALSGVHEVQRL
ncbi:RelA/SpoT family protein [Guggenheimella bovis]